MFVIVEGPKCCGKTTLCNRLAREYNGEIIHFPTNSDLGQKALEMLKKPLTPNEYEECQNLMEQDIYDTITQLDETKLWILDRSFISNAVYRSCEHLIIKDKFMKFLDKSMLIILLASEENIHEWIKIRSDKPLTQVEYSKLNWSIQRFTQLASILECTIIPRVEYIRVGKFVVMRTGK